MSKKPLGHFDAERFRATLSPEAYAGLTQATSQAAREAGHFTVLGRQPTLPAPDRLKAFAEGIGVDLYTARQRLLSPAPRIFRRDSDRDNADKWVAWLRALDLVAFRLSERAFSQFFPLPVVRFQREAGGLSFEIENGKSETIRTDEVLCIVHGNLRRRDVAETDTKDFFAGSIHKDRETLRLKRETLIDVHLRDFPLVFRLAQDKLKFHLIFQDSQPGSDLLMGQSLQILKSTYPEAAVLGDFQRAADVLGQSWQIVSQNTEFAYYSYGGAPFSMNQNQRRVVSESEDDAFDLYSLLSRMQLLST